MFERWANQGKAVNLPVPIKEENKPLGPGAHVKAQIIGGSLSIWALTYNTGAIIKTGAPVRNARDDKRASP